MKLRQQNHRNFENHTVGIFHNNYHEYTIYRGVNRDFGLFDVENRDGDLIRIVQGKRNLRRYIRRYLKGK